MNVGVNSPTSLVASMAARIAELEDALAALHSATSTPPPTNSWPASLVPDVALLRAQVATLNSYAPDQDSARPDPVDLVVYRTGLSLAGTDLPFGSPDAMQLLRDLNDGYAPEALKARYPAGVPLRVIDRSTLPLGACAPPAPPPAPASTITASAYASLPHLDLAPATTCDAVTFHVRTRDGGAAVVRCDARDTPAALARYLAAHGYLPTPQAGASRGSVRPGRAASDTQGGGGPRFRVRDGIRTRALDDEEAGFADLEVRGGTLYWD
ncbi:hypothetical protein H9P43_008810 [Blastocladiella emersonii ATCC 22665]|nr:hypothetical protein H9P43_008810 [Blastocladiella emersonii ATCC 22665]